LEQEINNALDVLKNGGTILYPTDTIWGIGCDATNVNAVEKVNNIKERQPEKGYIILASNIEMISKYVTRINNWENILEENKNATIIYPQSQELAPDVSNTAGTVAIRIPNNVFCLKLIKKLGKPIVSTSANKSGDTYPSSFSDVNSTILDAVGYTVKLRQNEETSFKPSSIIRITTEGTAEFIRE